ncbi:mechanosensitive ion channel family protein [Neolewinella aurantiaca]|uniref:Mechanosensitive ion channel family protein n=1 Tax=Neolewinella aurantiaca TaxID=2602767 RepID=A0A5C7FV22_9BACT|nr:mechanosensitive ion channel family protein [Neolewinella aurantiaca]TXF89372.1 mechanosensitive ion channel family protein [Neolewinella aurantiaca]
METGKIEEYLEMASDAVIAYAPKVIVALLILLIGIRVINKVVSVSVRSMTERGIGADLTPFLGSIVGIGLKLMLVFAVVTILGFDVAAFVGILAAAGFAVGLALQGSLSNFAAGIIIVLFRPYKIGDWVQVPDEFFGQVEEIQIFNTILITPGKKTLIVPNSEVISGVVTNYSEKGHIRLELTLLLGYEESFPKIKSVIEEALRGVEGILQDPAPEVGIESFDTHNVVVAVRPFVTPDDYWEGTFAVHAAIKSALSAAGIKMAYSEGVDLGPIGE